MSPATFPTHWDLHADNLFPPRQLHSVNFTYCRVPPPNVGFFEAPHLDTVLSLPSNPNPLLATQLAAQFTAQDRYMGLDLSAPVPHLLGRTPARGPNESD